MSASGLSVTNFAVQYSNATAAEIAASDYDLVVIEAKPLVPGTSDLSDAEVADLIAQGKVVSGYVSVGQTDESRPYWDAGWTDTTGLPIGEGDTGPLQDSAPDWVLEVANSWPARLVDFGDPDWKAIVIAQVEDMATRGYSAVFLDNILSYYELAAQRGELGSETAQGYAQDMMQLVIDIAAAARAINPAFAIIANGGPYIIGDAGAFGTDLATQYLDAVDGIMAESFFGLLNDARDENTLNVYETFWAAQGIDVLALEYSTDADDIAAFATEAAERGFAASVSPTQALDVLPAPIFPTVDAGITITGTSGADTLTGTDAANVILGKAGNDDLSGLAGDDTLIGAKGNDAVFGGIGGDDLRGGAGKDTLVGGRGNDVLAGDAGRDDLRGGKGQDTLIGGSGADALAGGDHVDSLKGGGGGDIVYGGRGNDVIYGGRGADILRGGRGNDDFFGGEGVDNFLFEMQGDDFIGDFTLGEDRISFAADVGYTVTNVSGGAQIEATNGASLQFEGLTKSELNQLLRQSNAPEDQASPIRKTIKGTATADNLTGTNGDDTLHGRGGNDRLSGKKGADLLDGGRGNDHLNGNRGHDVLNGGKGDDTLIGMNGNDTLDGDIPNFGGSNFGDDLLRGGRGDDTLNGNLGNDTLFGGRGNDVLDGGQDDDVLFGGAGADQFQFDLYADDVVGDFEVGIDQIIFVGDSNYRAVAADDGAMIIASPSQGTLELVGLTLSQANNLLDDAGF